MSSYEKNNYGNIFRALILSHKPKLVVECGVLNGYSTYYIANSLKFNKINRGVDSVFNAFDIWDDYDYKHGKYSDVVKMLTVNNVAGYVKLNYGNAFEVFKNYKDNTIDFIHFDISNDGDILLKMLDTWGKKINKDGMIVFEGGSEERDNGWIKTYNKKPIRHELINNPDIYTNWNIQIFDPYPSMTLMWRK